MVGLLRDEFDERDHYYVPATDAELPGAMNLRQDHAQLVSEIYDQHKTSSCTANATAAAFWFEEKAGRREETWGAAGPSRLFIYWLARGAYKNDQFEIPEAVDRGSCPRDAVRGIATCGACSETDWPFDVTKINERPSPSAIASAKPHKIGSFFRLDAQRPSDDKEKLSIEQKDQIGAAVLSNLKHCLAEGFPVIFGFWYMLPARESFDESQSPWVLKDVWALKEKPFPRHTFQENLPEELKIRSKYGYALTPGHTVLAIGYDDEKQAVLIQNSFGSSWGSGNGIFWMPYSWITDAGGTSDFWTIRCSGLDQDATPKKWEAVHAEILGQATP